MKKLIILYFATCLFGQSIQHEAPERIPAKIPFQIKVFVDLKPSEIYSFKLMYRFSHQTTYFETPMIATGIGDYIAEIPGNLISSGKVEYFFVIELSDNMGFLSFPQNDPIQHPIKVLINDSPNNSIEVQTNGINLQTPVTIMSPQPNTKIMKDDLLIAVSYFQLSNIDLESIVLFLDNKDVTSQSIIRESHLLFQPDKIYPGKHTISMRMRNTFGLEFTPVEWNFTLITKEEQVENEKSFVYSGRTWSDYSLNTVDSLQIEYNTINYDLRANMDWLKFRTKLMISSLESEFAQSRNRYFIDFNTPFLKLNFGDVYPDLGRYTINGYRVRGLDFKFTTKFIQLNFVQGQLARSVQGDPQDNAIIISDILDNTITLSRYNYTFEQDINAVNIGIGNPSKFHWNINAMKTKDNTLSVNRNVEGAVVELTNDIQQLYSTVFADLDGDGEYSDGDFIPDDFDNESEWWDVSISNNFTTPPINLELLESYSISTQIISSCGVDLTCDENEENYIEETITDPVGDNFDSNDNPSGTEGLNLIQYYWNVTLKDIDYNGDSIQIGDLTFTISKLSDDQWDGSKPEDNIVLGSDISMSFDNQKIKLKTGFAFSMLNQNIWNSVMSNADFDVLMDDYEDCYVGQSYDNVPIDLVWANCEASSSLNPNWSANENILTTGTSLDEIPFDPADFEDIFHMNINQVPLIPIDITTGEIGLGEILMMPSLAYNIDLSLNYLGHNLDFGFKQIGPEFNSLSNPYIQKDIREQSFSDRMRLLENRMFILFKWKRIEDGILEEEIGKTDKFDLNLSLYPGIDLPIFNIGFGSYIRDNGISESECYNEDGLYFTCSDTLTTDNTYTYYTLVIRKESTKSNQFNISVSNRFEFHGKQNIIFSLFSSEKTDLMADENQGNEDYYSPRSKSSAISLNLKSIYSNHWESTTYLSHSYYDYGTETESHPEYFQSQSIDNFDFTSYYKTTNYIKQLYAGLNISIGSGTASYNQYGFKLGVKIEPIQKLVIRTDYSLKYKSVEGEVDTYKNSSLIAKIQYLF